MIAEAFWWYWRANQRLFQWLVDHLAYTRAQRAEFRRRETQAEIQRLERELGIG